jgi:hypothetical protein
VRHYRCYFLINDRIKAAEDIGAKDDADALLRAEVCSQAVPSRPSRSGKRSAWWDV